MWRLVRHSGINNDNRWQDGILSIDNSLWIVHRSAVCARNRFDLLKSCEYRTSQKSNRRTESNPWSGEVRPCAAAYSFWDLPVTTLLKNIVCLCDRTWWFHTYPSDSAISVLSHLHYWGSSLISYLKKHCLCRLQVQTCHWHLIDRVSEWYCVYRTSMTIRTGMG